MLVRRCKNCDKPFIPKTHRHLFCSRDCFTIDYKNKNKVKQYPDYSCPDCGNKTRLTFFPRLSRAKWSKFKCPNCNQGNDNDDYQEVKAIKLSFKIEEFLDE